MKNKLLAKILCNVFAVLFGIISAGASIAFENSTAINSYLGVTTQKIVKTGESTPEDFYKTNYSSVEELREKSLEINREVLEEGMVLLKNENSALPLAKNSKVSLYSANSVTFVYAGSGSSSNLPANVAKHAVSLKDGLTSAGLTVNESLWNWYSNHTEYWQGDITTDGDGNKISTVSGNRQQTARFYTKDAPWADLPASAKESAEAAILVVSRNGGENADFYRNTSFATMSSGNYLELGDNEKDVLKNLKTLKDNGTISKIIVLMNSANQVQCDFADNIEYGVDALLWCGMTGSNGPEAIGRVLTGEVSPSGKLSDTFWYSHAENPVYANYGDMTFANSGILENMNKNKKYVVYGEGIYSGYRYTETRYEDIVTERANAGFFDYKTTVSYPFGYGLTYTSFERTLNKVEKFTDESGNASYNVYVTVKNVGEKPAKDVVQVYLQKPYTEYDKQNGVEKAAVELVGYKKTATLAPLATEDVVISVGERYFASYDANKAKTYVIGSDDKADKYYIAVSSDAHAAANDILAAKGYTHAKNSLMDTDGDASRVYSTYIAFNDVKYSTNKTIKKANTNFKQSYEGQEVNFGVDKITNAFDDVDFKKFDGFSKTEREQSYATRSDWENTLSKKITLTATEGLKAAQATIVPEADAIEYPEYGKESGLNIADLRAFDDGTPISYDNPLWDELLDKMTWKETVALLSDGLRQTGAVESINAPKTLQFNGATGPVPGDAADNSKYKFNTTKAPFEGFAAGTDGENDYPIFFCCNGIVASTFSPELQQKLGEQIGEECLWIGMSGIYGLGVNLHRGAYCGRNFEYYSEDGLLAGFACAYELKGIQSKGVFVILKHGLLNDQEDNRHGICTWANEQSIREIYLLPTEIAVLVGDEAKTAGMMTGLNRMGAKWCSVQGFCNTVLRAEFGMQGYIISDFYTKYMDPVSGVLYGNDLPDGTVAKDSKTYDGVTRNFDDYSVGYGKLAWSMREAAHRVLYTVVRSSAMNRMTKDTKVVKITPAWQTALTSLEITFGVLFALSAVYVVVTIVLVEKNKQNEATENE